MVKIERENEVEVEIGKAGLFFSNLARSIGAMAIGAAAIGVLAIGRLAIKKMRIDKLQIGTLEVDTLRVRRLEVLEDERGAAHEPRVAGLRIDNTGGEDGGHAPGHP